MGDRASARPHREQAERLIASIKDGAGFAAELLQDPPMSPEEAFGRSA